MKRFIALPLVAVLAACGGASDSKDGAATGGDDVALVAYSTPQVVYDDVIPAFQKIAAGRGVGFTQSYGASGDQSRAVANGQEADVVAFSLAPDVDRLVREGLVADDWASTPTRGMVSDSVVVLMVRKGNPERIRGWADLLRPGVEVLTPNPFTSGSAKWNLVAAYGAQLEQGRTAAQALAYLSELLTRHVKVQDRSGREAVQDFLNGNGDVCLSYENEAITAQQMGADVDYVIPRQTILIENPAAVTVEAPPQAQAFLDYLTTEPAQEAFARHGYRPVLPEVLARHAKEFPKPKQLFTIDDLGGWAKVDEELFDPDKGAVARIESDAGVSIDR